MKQGLSATMRRAVSSLPIARQIGTEGLLTTLKESIVPGLTVGSMAVPQALSYALLAGSFTPPLPFCQGWEVVVGWVHLLN